MPLDRPESDVLATLTLLAGDLGTQYGQAPITVLIQGDGRAAGQVPVVPRGARLMTGAFVRIERDGRWQDVEIDQLTDPELERFLAAQDVHPLRRWTRRLARRIRDRVQEAPASPPLAPGEGRG